MSAVPRSPQRADDGARARRLQPQVGRRRTAAGLSRPLWPAPSWPSSSRIEPSPHRGRPFSKRCGLAPLARANGTIPRTGAPTAARRLNDRWGRRAARACSGTKIAGLTGSRVRALCRCVDRCAELRASRRTSSPRTCRFRPSCRAQCWWLPTTAPSSDAGARSVRGMREQPCVCVS